METETKPQAKKQWTKPQLLVLVRHKPEECVLATCKTTGQPDASNQSSNNSCLWSCGGYCNSVVGS